MSLKDLLRGAYAILGGSFDPIHEGHLYLAKEVLSRTPIMKVVLVPCYRHNFKEKSIFLDYDARLELAKEAVNHFNPIHFIQQPAEDFCTPIEVWDSERGESGYTSDLIKKLKAQMPKQPFAFIIGADNVEQLPRWHDFEWLKENVYFIILPRPNTTMPCDVLGIINHHFLDIPMCDISSSEIRRRIKAGQSISGMVSPLLEEKITKLYTEFYER